MAFQIAEEAGEGARIRMRLGGKSGAASGDPVDLDVTVKKIARNVFQPYGPVMSPLGDMALSSSEHVDIAICTRRNQTFHADAVPGRRRRAGRLSRRDREVGAAFL
jgi:microcystin degradation protein MlrC